MPRDYRDDVIEALALSEAELRDQIKDLRAECDSYRAVAVAGIHHAHDQHITIVRLERQIATLRDEFRRLREQQFTSTGLPSQTTRAA